MNALTQQISSCLCTGLLVFTAYL